MQSQIAKSAKVHFSHWNQILFFYLHTSKRSQLHETNVCFLLFQPTHPLGDRNLFLSISEYTQGMLKACDTVTVLQIVQWAVFWRWSCTSRFCTVGRKMSLFLFLPGAQSEFQPFLLAPCWLLLSLYFTIICKTWQEYPINTVRWVVLSCKCTINNLESSKASSYK